MNDEELYSIGDAALRSGLSVSAVRFYSDAGIIEPTGLTEAGHRLYDVHAIARLELIRTLRDTYSTPPGRVIATTPVQDVIHTTGARLMEDLIGALPASAGGHRALRGGHRRACR